MSRTRQLNLAEDAEKFAAEVDGGGANVVQCLQCAKCTSGCPVADRADIKPHELVRLAQFGGAEELLRCRMIWECVSCQACATRCPQEVDVAALNDSLRQMSRSAGETHRETTVPKFNDIFLSSVRKRGRMYEMGLMVRYKLGTLKLLADIGKFPMMLWKRKLSLFGPKVRGRRRRKEMFRRARELGGDR